MNGWCTGHHTMALIFVCAYSHTTNHIGAKPHGRGEMRSGRLVRTRGGGALVADTLTHRRLPASSHQSFPRRLCSSPLVLRPVVLRMSRSRGSSRSFFLRHWLRCHQSGDPAVISCSRRRHCRPPSLEWQCANCNRSRGVHMCHHISNRSRGCMCVAVAVEFTIVAIAGAAVAAHNDLPQSQAVMSHIRLQSRVVRSNCRPQSGIVA